MRFSIGHGARTTSGHAPDRSTPEVSGGAADARRAAAAGAVATVSEEMSPHHLAGPPVPHFRRAEALRRCLASVRGAAGADPSRQQRGIHRSGDCRLRVRLAAVRADEAELLWRVRRKLILSYIFIGVVPSLLIIVFFLFCSAVLFMGVAAYLFKSGYDKVIDDVKVVAQAAALEISRNPSTAAQTIERVHRIRSRQYPALSVVYVAADGTWYRRGPLGAHPTAPTLCPPG